MKQGSTLYYLTGDLVGSTSMVLDNSGNVYSRRGYFPYGEVRFTTGSTLPTDFTFTGQRYDGADLMDYGARQYEIVHGQFLQPDSIVPNVMDPQSWNRYAYTLNNPVRYTDPTGHMVSDEEGGGNGYNDQPYEGPDYTYVIEPELPTEPTTPTDPCVADPSDPQCKRYPPERERETPTSPTQQGKPPLPAQTPTAQAPNGVPTPSAGTPYPTPPWRGAITLGLAIAGEVLAGAGVDIGFYSADSDGDWTALTVTPSLRATSDVGVSAMLYMQRTTGKVKDLDGGGGSFGGCGGYIVGGCFEKVKGANESYTGERVSVGVVAGPVPASVQGSVGYTFMPFGVRQ